VASRTLTENMGINSANYALSDIFNRADAAIVAYQEHKS